MIVRRVRFMDNFSNSAIDSVPRDWTNIAGQTNKRQAGAGGTFNDLSEHFCQLEHGASAQAVLQLDSPPPGDEVLQYFWRMFELSGNSGNEYASGIVIEANGTDPTAGGFTGYTILQFGSGFQITRYNSGTPTIVFTETTDWVAEYGRTYCYHVKYNPSTGEFVLRRGDYWEGRWDIVDTFTDGSPISDAGQDILLYAAAGGGGTGSIGFDDFRITDADDEYFDDIEYNVPINAVGSFVFTTINEGTVAFSRWEVNDVCEVVIQREDGLEFVEFRGHVEKLEDDSVRSGRVRLSGRDLAGEFTHRTAINSFASDVINVALEVLLVNGIYCGGRLVKPTGQAITRNYVGRPIFDAAVELAREAGYFTRLLRTSDLLINDIPQPGSKGLAFLEAALARGANLQGFWPFNEVIRSGAVVDLSGNAKYGTLNNGGREARGIHGTAYDFIAASSSYVSLPNGLVSSFTDFTWEAWIFLDSAATYSRIFDFGTGTTNYMFLTPANTWGGGTPAGVGFAIKKTSGSEEHIAGSAALPTGEWVHVACVLSGSTGYIYVNGAQVATGTMATNPSDLGTTTNTWIGRSQFVADPYLDGQICDMALYDEALDGPTILAHYNAGRYGVLADEANGDIFDPVANQDGFELKNKVRVYGSTGISGFAEDTTSQAQHGIREVVVVDERITSSTDAGNLATNLKNQLKDLTTGLTFGAADFHELYVGEILALTMGTQYLTSQEYIVIEKAFRQGKLIFNVQPVGQIFNVPSSPEAIIQRAIRDASPHRWRQIG